MPEESKTLLPSQSIATDGKYLKSDGDKASWQDSDAGAEVSAHNTSETAHGDIRGQLSAIDTQLADKANKTQEGWIAATLLNGWTGIVRYAKNDLGLVMIEINATVGSKEIASDIAILPVGYRPYSEDVATLREASHTGLANTTVFINSTGALKILITPDIGRIVRGTLIYKAV